MQRRRAHASFLSLDTHAQPVPRPAVWICGWRACSQQQPAASFHAVGVGWCDRSKVARPDVERSPLAAHTLSPQQGNRRSRPWAIPVAQKRPPCNFFLRRRATGDGNLLPVVPASPPAGNPGPLPIVLRSTNLAQNAPLSLFPAASPPSPSPCIYPAPPLPRTLWPTTSSPPPPACHAALNPSMISPS